MTSPPLESSASLPRVWGVTGGIGSGKSTVSQMLRALGAAVIDADQLAREVVAVGQPGLAEVAARFPGVLAPDGSLHRPSLAARIFQDPAEREALNHLLHPRIAAAFQAQRRLLGEQGLRGLFYDVPLLIERGLQSQMDGVLLVWVPRDLQKQRLQARDGLSEAEAETRLLAQLPLDAKRPFARWIVDNQGSLTETQVQVEEIWQSLKAFR